ncbi:MAG: hypothetical protein ACYDDV_07925 [Methanoregula sp.]
MKFHRNESLSSVFVSRMIGIICFLIFVVLANILTYYISNPIYRSGVVFLDENFWFLLIISFIMLAADIFFAFTFPLNLPAPIIRAFGSVFIIAFLLLVFKWIDTVVGTSLYPMVWLMSFVIVPIVFIVVLVNGYFEIMRILCYGKQKEKEGECQVVHEVKSTLEEPVSDVKSWEDIGSEFRLMMFDIMHRFRHEVRKK